MAHAIALDKREKQTIIDVIFEVICCIPVIGNVASLFSLAWTAYKARTLFYRLVRMLSWGIWFLVMTTIICGTIIYSQYSGIRTQECSAAILPIPVEQKTEKQNENNLLTAGYKKEDIEQMSVSEKREVATYLEPLVKEKEKDTSWKSCIRPQVEPEKTEGEVIEQVEFVSPLGETYISLADMVFVSELDKNATGLQRSAERKEHNKKWIGKKVKVAATIDDVYESRGTFYVRVSDKGSMAILSITPAMISKSPVYSSSLTKAKKSDMIYFEATIEGLGGNTKNPSFINIRLHKIESPQEEKPIKEQEETKIEIAATQPTTQPKEMTDKKQITIMIAIDGSIELRINQNGFYLVNKSGVKPSYWYDTKPHRIPVLVNNKPWLPSWGTKGIRDADKSSLFMIKTGEVSATIQSNPAMVPEPGSPVPPQIWSEPSEISIEGDREKVICVSDNGGGTHWYKIILTIEK